MVDRHEDTQMTKGNIMRSEQIAQLRHSNGLTLIEVMIALLVLSIGLVGLASIHLISLKSAHSSYYRSFASTGALNAEERLWQLAQENLTTPGQCVSDTSLETLQANLQQDWRAGGTSSTGWTWTETELAGIPSLTVTFGQTADTNVTRADPNNDGSWTDRWRQIPIRLTWTETRLGDASTNDQDFTESFDYTMRIPCVPEFVPNP